MVDAISLKLTFTEHRFDLKRSCYLREVKLNQVFLIVNFIAVALSSCQSKLPELSITHDSEINWDKKQLCLIDYRDGLDHFELPASIKGRGGYSRRYDKDSYTLELQSDLSIGGIPADDDWILNASYVDKTLMRHKICYDLYREMHRQNLAPQCAYLELNFNQDYKGIYVAMEKVNRDFVGINKTDRGACLFKGSPVFYEQRLDQVQDQSNYYHQKFPELKDHDHSQVMDELHALIFESDDSTFLAEISNSIDLRMVMDWHLLLLYTNNSDGLRKNFYLYKTAADHPVQIAIWDYDHSFGRDGDNELNMLKSVIDDRRNPMLKRLLDTPGSTYAMALKSRYHVLRDSGIFSLEKVTSMIESNDAILRSSLNRHFQRWPTDAKDYYDDSSYQEELELILDFCALRLEQLDERFGYSL